jgi:cation diffusion facilitator family transporter
MTTPRAHDLRPFVHSHAFGDEAAPQRERALWWVTGVTLATMVMELVVGYWSGSLALVADGWHMGTHALALGGAAMAARIAHQVRASARFAFGGWKIEVLSAYSSGLLLLAVSVWIGIDAMLTLFTPHPIAYAQAIVVAVLGLLVNGVCAWMLERAAGGHEPAQAHPPAHDHPDSHHHGHAHSHSHAHAHDHNYRAATLHVMADALTSVLAIVALGAGMALGWRWLDPMVALAGGALIARWAFGVLRDSARALVDASADTALRDAVRHAVETDGDAHVADLHVWQVGPAAWSALVSIVADAPLATEHYRARLAALAALRHVTIEVHRCQGCEETPPMPTPQAPHTTSRP